MKDNIFIKKKGARIMKSQYFKTVKHFFNAMLVVLFCVGNIAAQDQTAKRTCGLSALFQESQFDIVIPFWAGQQAVIAPAVGVMYVEDGGTDITAGLLFRIYGSMKRVTPYGGIRVGAVISTPKDGKSVSDFLFGLLYGGEFFLAPQFSIGVEAQVNLIKSDEKSGRFGNPGAVNVNTATAVVANVYF